MAPFIQPSAEKFAEPRGICKDEFCILINKVNTQTIHRIQSVSLSYATM